MSHAITFGLTSKSKTACCLSSAVNSSTRASTLIRPRDTPIRWTKNGARSRRQLACRTVLSVRDQPFLLVQGDGQLLYRSKVLRAGDRETGQCRYYGGQSELELLTEGGEGHPHNSWAIWAAPVLFARLNEQQTSFDLMPLQSFSFSFSNLPFCSSCNIQ